MQNLNNIEIVNFATVNDFLQAQNSFFGYKFE